MWCPQANWLNPRTTVRAHVEFTWGSSWMKEIEKNVSLWVRALVGDHTLRYDAFCPRSNRRRWQGNHRRELPLHRGETSSHWMWRRVCECEGRMREHVANARQRWRHRWGSRRRPWQDCWDRSIARNVTGWPASRHAKILMKIELNSIKKKRISKTVLASGKHDSACFRPGTALCYRMKQDVASDGERERAEGKQVVVVVGKGTEKLKAQKILPRYGRVHVDCHASLAWRPSRSFRRWHTAQRHRQQCWLREQPVEDQILAVVC